MMLRLPGPLSWLLRRRLDWFGVLQLCPHLAEWFMRVPGEDQRLNAADEKIIELEQENAEQKKADCSID